MGTYLGVTRWGEPPLPPPAPGGTSKGPVPFRVTLTVVTRLEGTADTELSSGDGAVGVGALALGDAERAQGEEGSAAAEGGADPSGGPAGPGDAFGGVTGGLGTSPPHHSPCWDWGHWCRSPFWDKALGQRARAGQLLLGGAGAAVPPQTLAPSSTWSMATPRRVSPRSPGPRLSHRQEGPPSPGPPLASSTVPSCSPDPFPEPTGPKAEVAGLPPGPGAVGTAQHPPGDTPATGLPEIIVRSRSKPAGSHVQQTQRFGSTGASVAKTSPFCPKLCEDEAGAPRTAPGRGGLGTCSRWDLKPDLGAGARG